eukprot:364221-Chlamydomonas_euryale.AAC.4
MAPLGEPGTTAALERYIQQRGRLPRGTSSGVDGLRARRRAPGHALGHTRPKCDALGHTRPKCDALGAHAPKV